ncbi:MAG: hypothetical protein BLM47_02040 [Candidatus Reconcilbacillus cellulovorans]|uniref:DUF4309 domain-containing protein n=1 Tax=Candidatus Reconcilbacillus cellulovorans TaxID=1906605 RepID=A0A2A6E443_9BACL|nr:MAG: hypothetical protein BLM47_02040 [Candidatus Reconcilbacillus cellulovorans]
MTRIRTQAGRIPLTYTLTYAVARALPVALAAGLAAGCAASGGTAEQTVRPTPSAEQTKLSATTTPDGFRTAKPVSPEPSPTLKEATEIASHPSSSLIDTGRSPDGNAAQATPVAGRRPFALFGLKPGDPKHSAEARLGPPASTYVLNDEETGGILVYEYGGYQVGFDPHERIVFIDVRSENTDPGLGSIRVRSDADAVVRALGRPTSRTDRVLTYERDGAVLKFDLDPGRDSVLSIKLFAASPGPARP